MTQKIFPENEIFQHKIVKKATIKNKSYKLEKTEDIHVQLLEKGDFIKVKGPFKLLNDSIIVDMKE